MIISHQADGIAMSVEQVGKNAVVFQLGGTLLIPFYTLKKSIYIQPRE